MGSTVSKIELTNQEISRQLDLVPPSILDEPVTIIGAGAIGSWVALGLAKSGFKHIAVFDHDEVDVVNMSSQFYGIDDIGTLKVEALADRIEEMTGTIITAIPEKWTGMKMRGTVIMAADSMEVRKQIFEAHRGNLATNWLIDARMGAEIALLYAFNPNDPTSAENYEKSLYSDAEAVQERCTAKSTTYCAIVLSGLIIKAVRDALMPGKLIRNLTLNLRENDWICFSNDLRPQVK
jgi:hypothetical protein